MRRNSAPRKDHDSPLEHAHLHALADAIWRTHDPGDARAASFAAAAQNILNGHSPAHRRAANWIHTLHEYEQFWGQHKRTPRENTRARHTLTTAERHLGEWARYQRRFEQHLNGYQRARLEVSPAFVWDLREASWERNLTACQTHRQRTGQLPRLTSRDPQEFALARWLGRQLKRLRLGELEPERRSRLERLLRPWDPPCL